MKSSLPQQQQQQQQQQGSDFAALLQQPLLQPVYSEQQLQQLQQQGRAFAVAPIRDRGLGFIALQSLPEGFVVYEEEPLLWQQHALNKGLVRACCCCGKPLGDPLFQLSHFFSSSPESMQHLQALNLNHDLLLQLQQQQQQQLQQQQQQQMVLCPGNCGEGFCNSLCLERDVIHRELCVGCLQEDSPLVAFKRFAMLHCENLLLAAAAIVAAAAAAAARKGAAANAAETAAAAKELLLLLLLQHQHGVWEAEGDEETEETEEERETIVKHGAELLLQGLRVRSEVYVHLISASLVSRLLSLFERNNSNVELQNPLNSFFSFCLSHAHEGDRQSTLRPLLLEKETLLFLILGSPEEQQESEETDAADEETEESLEQVRARLSVKPIEELFPAAAAAAAPAAAAANGVTPRAAGRLFPSVCGSGFYCSVARVNHSCKPNMVIEGLGFSSGMRLRLTEPVTPGTELCVSYIEGVQGLEKEDRSSRLRAFGFDCNCTFCSNTS